MYDAMHAPKQDTTPEKLPFMGWTLSPYSMVTDVQNKLNTNPWLIERLVQRYNKKNNTHWTKEDYQNYSNKYSVMPGVIKGKKKDKVVVLPISDTHIGKLCKIPCFDNPGKENIVYSVEHFMKSHLRYRQAIESLIYDFELRSTIESIQIISLGDLIDGDGRIYKTQPFNLEPSFDTPLVQKRFCVDEFLIPFIEWLKGAFSVKDVKLFMCAGNHEAPGYDVSDFNNATYEMANKLNGKKYDVSCEEFKQWYGLVKVKGWGFLCTHGHGIKLGQARPTIERKLMMTKFETPGWQFYLEGHWHNSKMSGQYVQSRGENNIHYYRSSTTIPVGADRHSSKFMGGDNTWWMLTIDENQGLIDERSFDMSKLEL